MCVNDLGIGGCANVFLDVGENRAEDEGTVTPSSKNSFSRLGESFCFKLITCDPFFQTIAHIFFEVPSLELWPYP